MAYSLLILLLIQEACSHFTEGCGKAIYTENEVSSATSSHWMLLTRFVWKTPVTFVCHVFSCLKGWYWLIMMLKTTPLCSETWEIANIGVTFWRKLIYNYIPFVQVRDARVTRPFYFLRGVGYARLYVTQHEKTGIMCTWNLTTFLNLKIKINEFCVSIIV